MSPTTPNAQRMQSITYKRFRLFRFRSPLLSESLVCFLFVLLLRCFSSQAFLPKVMYWLQDYKVLTLQGFPIRNSRDQGHLATPPSLSQLYTSFIGWRCQGIPHQLFVALPNISGTDKSVLNKQISLMITFIISLFNNSLSNNFVCRNVSPCLHLPSQTQQWLTPAHALIYAYILMQFSMYNLRSGSDTKPKR